MFPDYAPFLVSSVLQDCSQSKTESELTFCCRCGLFGVLICCLYSMDEMLIHFSLVFDRWTTTPMPPSEPTNGSVVMGCTTIFSHLTPGCAAPFWLHGDPTYRGHPYCQFRFRRCKVHVDIPAHPTDPTMTAWFTMARGDDLDGTLERAAH
jgi:hypothetical protein